MTKRVITSLFNKKNYPKILLFLFLVFWVFIAISPWYREAWVAENILTVFFVGLLIFTYNKFRFSNLSYTLFFTILFLHTIGSYYTYTEMPLFDLLRDSFGLARNHYDRVVHFLFGILFFIPTYEFISKKFRVKGFWGLFLSFLIIIALKGTYEVFEYLYVILTKSEIIGQHYLGMQDDEWDTQKDIALGMLGSAMAWVGFWIKDLWKK